MSVTVSGGGTTVLTFNVTGSAATNYATDFSGALGNPSAVNILSNGGSFSSVPGALNEVYSNGTFGDYTVPGADQYTYVAVGDPTTVNGASGDTLIGGAFLTYVEAPGAGDNRVVFTDGNNIFEGSSTGGAGDTIAGGTGYDTIVTGGGPSTVFSGVGHTLIELNDTTGGDLAVLQSGNSTVVAGSGNDTVNASATGTIFGGTGSLTFVADASSIALPVTIVGGSGTTDMFGASNLDLTLAGGGTNIFIAGAGNETLNGANSTGFYFYGDTASTDSVQNTVVGGSGFDYFSTGAGTEYFQAGTGADSFNIASIDGGANITIADFGASDSVSFAATITNEASDGTNYSVTLSDGTHVEFLGITNLTGHIT